MNKSVAIVCEYAIFPERIGGMDRFFVAFDKELKQLGYTATWFFKNIQYHEFYTSVTLVDAKNQGVEEFFLSYCSTKGKTYDLLITHFIPPVGSFYKNVSKNAFASQSIAVEHNPHPLGGFSYKKRLINKLKGIIYGRYTHYLVGVSKYTSSNISKDYGSFLKNKIVTIYNGIDVSNVKHQVVNRTGKPIPFVIVSHLRKSKGVQDVLSAISLLEDSIKHQISVTIFGEGPIKQQLQRFCKTHQLDSIVSFKGNSPMIQQELSQFAYLVQPTYMECFSLSLLESLAANVPVITTDVGGNIELITHGVNGFIHKPMRIESIASIITNIVTGTIKIEKDVSHLVHEKYTLEMMVRNHLKIVQSCT